MNMNNHQLTKIQFHTDIQYILEDSTLVLTDDLELVDLGLDSIRLMLLIEKWRKNKLDINFIELAERSTVGEWWQCLENCPVLLEQ